MSAQQRTLSQNLAMLRRLIRRKDLLQNHQIEQLRCLCAAAYQVVGAADGPTEMLDNLSAAASEGVLPHHPMAGLPWAPCGWQPIETAPEKTRVLVTRPAPAIVQIAVKWPDAGWLSDDGFADSLLPTHWQPLPEAPCYNPPTPSAPNKDEP